MNVEADEELVCRSIRQDQPLASFVWASSMPFLNSWRLDPSDRAKRY